MKFLTVLLIACSAHAGSLTSDILQLNDARVRIASEELRRQTEKLEAIRRVDPRNGDQCLPYSKSVIALNQNVATLILNKTKTLVSRMEAQRSQLRSDVDLREFNFIAKTLNGLDQRANVWIGSPEELLNLLSAFNRFNLENATRALNELRTDGEESAHTRLSDEIAPCALTLATAKRAVRQARARVDEFQKISNTLKGAVK